MESCTPHGCQCACHNPAAGTNVSHLVPCCHITGQPSDRDDPFGYDPPSAEELVLLEQDQALPDLTEGENDE